MKIVLPLMCCGAFSFAIFKAINEGEMSVRTALVIGGTGPTGHYMVNDLLGRGYQVTILHRGPREVEEIPPEVTHIHTDPYDEATFSTALSQDYYDLCIACYGRLRMIAKTMRGRCGQFISIGGAPAYAGYMNSGLYLPPGLPVPTREDARLVTLPEEDEKGYRIVQTEQEVFELHPVATHFRYPFIYGKYQPVPREWCIVRRIIDERPFIILPEDGLTLCSYGYARNMAHSVLLAVDNPAAAGEIFNCADDEVFSLRQVVEIICAALSSPMEILSMPYELAVPSRPLIGQPLPTHRVLDTAKIKHVLGYEDLVSPREALAYTALRLADNPPESGGIEEVVLQDPFDYAAEDALAQQWKQALGGITSPDYETRPQFGMAYSGPGGRQRMNKDFRV